MPWWNLQDFVRKCLYGVFQVSIGDLRGVAGNAIPLVGK